MSIAVRAPFRARLPRVAVWAVPIAIAGIGFVLRLLVLLRGGGLNGIGAYDDGVYYAAAASLVHGRLPYLSFLFIQPPGIVLAAAPFAALGAVAGDPTGFAVGRIAFELVGGLNAALVFLVLRRYGRIAPVVGGLLYAVLAPAVYAERSILLEPIGTLGILVCLLLLQRAGSDRLVLLAGVAAGWSMDVKIWFVVPVAVIALLAVRHRGRFAAGVGIALAAASGPFLLAAPVTVVREVLLDQLGRPRTPGRGTRLAGMVGARAIAGLDLRTVTVVLVVLALTAAAMAATVPGARVFPGLLAADAAVLIASPSWFEHYGDLTAAPLALCVGLGVQQALALVPPRPVRLAVAATVAAAVVVGGVALDHRMRSGTAVPAALTAAVARTSGCVTSDDPTVLASTDVLSRDLTDPRCKLWPDVTGWTYDAAADRFSSGAAVPRQDNPRWQRMVLSYLESGRATIAVRPATGLSGPTRSELDEGRPISTDGHFVLRSADRDGPAGSRT